MKDLIPSDAAFWLSFVDRSRRPGGLHCEDDDYSCMMSRRISQVRAASVADAATVEALGEGMGTRGFVELAPGAFRLSAPPRNSTSSGTGTDGAGQTRHKRKRDGSVAAAAAAAAGGGSGEEEEGRILGDLASAAAALEAGGWPATFLIVFDEAWALMAQLLPLLVLASTGYGGGSEEGGGGGEALLRMVANQDVLVWHVPRSDACAHWFR